MSSSDEDVRVQAAAELKCGLNEGSIQLAREEIEKILLLISEGGDAQKPFEEWWVLLQRFWASLLN